MRICWIDQFNDEYKIAFGTKKKTALTLAGQSKVKSRYVEVRKEMKTSVGGRERNFIEKEHWDEKLDGKYDKSKEITEFIQGRTRTGCWKWIGRAGVWKGTTEESTTIVDAHVEESGCGGLFENAADVKANTLKTGLLAMEAECDTHSVEAPVLGFEDLLSLAGFNQEAPLLGGMPGEAEEGGVEEQAAADAEEGVPENSDESESSQDDKARCSGYFAVPGATASGRIAKGVAPKAAPTKVVAHTASGQATKAKATGKGAKPKAVKAGVIAKTKAAGQANQPTLRVDGRSERLRKGIDEDLQKVGDALKLVAFNESVDGLFLTGDALKAFQQELTKKAQVFALQKSPSEHVRRKSLVRSKDSLRMDWINCRRSLSS